MTRAVSGSKSSAWRVGLCGVLLAVAATGAVKAAEPAQPPVDLKPVTLRNSGETTLQSVAGDKYRIFISTPTEKAPPEGWPVIYVLDGNAWFAPFSAQAQMMGRRPDHNGLLPAIVVGIGYPGDRNFYMSRRVPDFTPAAAEREKAPEGWVAPGGADRFLDFIETRVKPLVLREYKADPKRQSIFGHSLGGLLVLHAYFTRPDSYANFTAVSSSIWWNGEYILDEEKTFTATLAKGAPSSRLLLAIGGSELPDMVAASDAMAARLGPRVSDGLRFEYLKIAGEEHVTVPVPAFTRMLERTMAATDAERQYYKPAAAVSGPVRVPGSLSEYLRLTPAERTRIRIAVRAMPEAERKVHEQRVTALVDRASVSQRTALQQEELREDRRNGSVAVED